MQATVNELGDSRVKIDVEVSPEEVEGAINHMAEHLKDEVKVEGFREGKVPPELVIQKLGRETVLAQAIEHTLADWYERSLLETGISPVGDPKVDLPDLPGEKDPLKFSIEVGVRPPAKVDDYKGVEVGKPEVEVPKDAVDAELERLREGFAKLNTVDREAKDGDVLLIDFNGTIDGEDFEGGEGRDYLVELGSNQVLEGFEEALKGVKADDEREAKVPMPEDHPDEKMRGKEATFKITVKEVREKELRDLDDEFAQEASEFETMDELRSHIEGRIKELLESRAEEGFRAAALDEVAKKAEMDLPDELVNARAAETWERVERQLQQRGVDPAAYLSSQGKSREEIIAEAKPEAEMSLRREGALEAVADAEKIEISDDELKEALAPVAEREGAEPDEVFKRLQESGRDKLLRQDLRMRKALESIAEHAKPIPVEQAQAREAIWTPGEEKKEKKELWTPGS